MNLKNWVDRLIWATILVTVVRYAAAFMASDLGEITGGLSNIVTFFLTLTGLGMGILDTIGGGLLFNGWSKVFPKSGISWSIKFKILTFCVFSLIFSGLIILVPFTVSRLAHESILDTLGGKSGIMTWVWSTMVNFIPYVLIIGVFAGNKMVTALESSEESFQKDKPKQKEIEETFPKDWRNLRPTLTYEQVEELAQLSPGQIKAISKKHGVDEKTVSNWRSYSKREVEMRKENESRR